MIGRTLSHFEITAKLGAGGMGEVYRARDTRLGRDVAFKVLPEQLQRDDKLRQRLTHEAEAISQLQHPNICSLYDIGREDGIDFLVMELLEGETLEQRLRRGRLPVPEALAIGAQIAAALERAHRHGIVHRDLKPGNVMLTADGAKVLDFGLAKEFAGAQSTANTGSPTALMTDEGTIAGTIQYMAPEQLHGQPVDARTDIFALGCVLHEMLTGSRPFEGESQASLIAAILDHEPPALRGLVSDSPPGLGRVVERCMAKDPEQRWQSSGDVQALLEDLAGGEFPGAPQEAAPPRGRAALVGAVAAVGLALLVGVWIGGAFKAPEATDVAPRIERYPVDQVGDVKLGELSNPVLSRDGDKVAFVANSEAGLQIYLRRLDELLARPVEGTGNAGWFAFSPDGEQLLFFDVVSRSLKRVSIHGGTASEVVSPSYLPVAWGNDGYIYYPVVSVTSQGTPDSKGLWRIPAAGGEPEQLTRAEPIRGTGRYRAHTGPELLPGGSKLLFTVGDEYLHSGWDAAVLDLDSGDWQRVFEGANQVRVVAGHLVFWRDNRLWAAPFDLEQLKVLAVPKPVLDGIARHPLAPVEVGQYQVTAAGDLVYLSGGSATEEIGRLVAAPFGGDELVLLSKENERIFGTKLAPDGRRVAFARCSNFNSTIRDCRIWTLDLETRSLAPITTGRRDYVPHWEASGKALIYTAVSDDNSMSRLMRQPLDGSAVTVLLEGPGAGNGTAGGSFLAAAASHRDGRLVYGSGGLPEIEIRLLSPDGSDELLVEAARQMATDLSADGRWLVFHSDRSGQFELYALDLYAEGARPRQITTEGALFGRFAPDGRSLYFRSRAYPGPAEILRAPFDLTTGLLGEAESMMETAAQGFTSSWWQMGNFVVTEDGLVLSQLRTPPRTGRIILVRNWAAEMVERLR